jgi:LysM repeat protein
MQAIRITKADGSAWTHNLTETLVNIGRGAENQLVLEDPAVSSHHCLLEHDGYNYVIKDRGSANGTFINNVSIQEPTVLREGDRLYVGPFLIELVSMAPVAASGVAQPVRRFGPLIRGANPMADAAREHDRLRRWAMEWDAERRPRHLLLRDDALSRALELMSAPDSPVAGNPMLREYVAKSSSAASARTAVRAVMLVGVLLVVAAVAAGGWWWWSNRPQEVEGEGETDGEEETGSVESEDDDADDDDDRPAPAVEEEWVEHVVIPAETLDDVARRYDVPLQSVARWNRLNPDEPEIEVGQSLRIKPKARPLPQQEIAFELDKPYDWRSLAERFGVEVSRLRAYNPKMEELRVGDIITVWIDPKPYSKGQLGTIPVFDIRPDATSIGRPNDGKIDNAIQLPASDLYTRRAPFIQWGSSHTIETLQTSVARFRQEVSFEGEVVISDISRKHGGNFFPPHKSHQAGRDIDIWMPTLKGVYKKHYLDKERKPQPNEIDWYATWGLIRALIDSGEIVHIFLTWELQEKLRHAAKLMGATDEELRRYIQYPRRGGAAVVQHSPGHTGHIHVRFKCGPNDKQCKDDVSYSGE